MADPAIPPSSQPDSPRPREKIPPPLPGTASPFGSIAQYKRMEEPSEFVHFESVTGATVADPGRKNIRRQLRHESDWSSHVRWFTKPMEEFLTSLAIYWLGYSVIQTLLVAAFAMLHGSISDLSSGTVAAMLGFGPWYGVFLDVYTVASGSWAFPLGVVFLLAEPFLFFLFFFSTEWNDRGKCCGMMLGLIFFRTLVLSFTP